MSADEIRTRRRKLLAAALGAALAPALPALAATQRAQPLAGQSGYHGGLITPPVPVPDMPLRTADGHATRLRALLAGRVTALQLFYTGCSSTCPIQGAVFHRVQTLLGPHPKPDIQLLSLSISPLEDTPQRMHAWLARFGARPGWIAAAPELKDVDALQAFFGGGRTGLDNHGTQVQMIDRRGALVWRTYELPSPETIAALLGHA